jgi:tetratricopeptide (TPR) repeat protein
MSGEPNDSQKLASPPSGGEERAPAEGSFAARAEALRAQGRHDEAMALLQEGLEKRPDCLPARLLLGRCYWEKEMPGEAKIELEKVSAVIEECLPVYKYLSKVYVHERKDVDKALEAVRRALYFTAREASRKQPAPSAPSEMDLDASGLRRPSPLPAPPAGEGAPEANANAGRSGIQTDTLAAIFVKQGKPEKALAIYAKILNEDPHNEAVRRKFEALQKKTGNKDEPAERERMIAALEKWLERARSKKGKQD